MTTAQQLFYEEYLSPLYKKYEDDPNFTVESKNGQQCWNIQYALVQESIADNLFQPVLFEEEDGRQLIVGFKIAGRPEYVFPDAQYAKKDGVMSSIFLDTIHHFTKTGQQVGLISYVGFADAYLEETV